MKAQVGAEEEEEEAAAAAGAMAASGSGYASEEAYDGYDGAPLPGPKLELSQLPEQAPPATLCSQPATLCTRPATPCVPGLQPYLTLTAAWAKAGALPAARAGSLT